MGRPGGGGATVGNQNDVFDGKQEQKLQAVVLLADSLDETSSFGPIGIPSALCPLNNIPLLHYSLEFLCSAGVRELFLFCFHSANVIESHLPRDSRMKIHVLEDASCTNVGDVLRELDKRNVIQSDPFILLHDANVVTNVHLAPVLQRHRERRERDASAIMTILLRPAASAVGGTKKDLSLVGMNPDRRLLLLDGTVIPTSFFASATQIDIRCDLIDVGIDICSPDVLARFSDEFDYRHVRSQFVKNSVGEEEESVQNKIYAHIIEGEDYVGNVSDFKTYASVGRDILQRWCFPIVPDKRIFGTHTTTTTTGVDERREVVRYERMTQRRLFVYRAIHNDQQQTTRIGRSTELVGPGMVGIHCSIGEGCIVKGTVLGNDCHIQDNCVLQDCYLWENVTLDSNVTVLQSVICNDCVIKKGATISRGCVLGPGCIIGQGVVLPEFTRLTLRRAEKDNHVFANNDFDSTSSLDRREEHGSSSDEKDIDAAPSDHDVVGSDGRGRVWLPPPVETNDDDSHSGEDGQAKALELLKFQSMDVDGTAASSNYKKMLENDDDDDDEFSDFESPLIGADCNSVFDSNVDRFANMSYGDGVTAVGGGNDASFFEADTKNGDEFIVGRQRGVDVVKELKALCLEHDTSSPIENLAIELNSFKFSQNATFADCATGAILAVLERMNVTRDTSAARMVLLFKNEMVHWGPLFKKFCHGTTEEKALLTAIEDEAIRDGNGDLSRVLGTEPSFRFVLQTLFDLEIVTEEAILDWAAVRRELDEAESAQGRLFRQQHTQDFLEWLQEDSESNTGSDDDDDDDDDDGDDELSN